MHSNESESQSEDLATEDKYVISIDSSDVGRLRISAGDLTESTDNSKVPWRTFKGMKIHYFIPPNGNKALLYKYRANEGDKGGLERRIELLEDLVKRGKAISSEELVELLDEVN